ncbi:MAG: tetratricopeptide repeat protein [Alphaproteobacteria bacterium]|nr:tetratricopeptide repeat protein [Alphaproteobacteria bacterium]
MDADQDRRARLAEGLTLLGALGVRVAAWRSIGKTPYADNPLVDAYTYWDQARALLNGQDPFAEGFYQPPGYPWLLAAVFRLAGGEADPAVGRALNLALGLLTTALVMLCGRALARRLQGPWWAGALAGAVYTLYPSTLLFELDLLTPAVSNALFTGALALVLLGERPGWGRTGASGLLIGLAAMVHPTVLIAAPVFAGVLWLSGGGGARAAVWLLGLALGVAPTAWINQTRWGQTALVSHNAGINFYLGNNPDWKTTAFLRPGLPFRALVLEADPGARDTFTRNDYWRERALSEIRGDPGAWVGTMLTKAVWSVNNREIPRNEDYRCRTADGPMAWLGWLPVRYGPTLPFAALGALVLLADPRRRASVIPMAWASLQIGMILFLVSDRYRVSTWPLVSLCAAVGAGELARRWPARALPPRGWVVVVGLAAVAPWLPIDRITAFSPGWCWHQKGNFALQESDWAEAERWYRKAVEREPDNIGAWHWLGTALVRLDRPDEAIEAFDRVLRDFPLSYSTLMAAAETEHDRKRYAEEAEYLGKACEVPGPRDSTCARFVQALVAAGQRERALAFLQQHPELEDHPRVKRAFKR